MQVVIYKNDEGGVSVIYPTPEALIAFGIDAIAQKDVPTGKPYKIINEIDLPDRSQRNQWDVDEALLIDGIGNVSNTIEVTL